MKAVFLRKKPLLCLAAVTSVLFAAAIIIFGTEHAPVSAGEGKLLPIYEVETDSPLVAVSFDASWGAEYTPRLLDILDDYGAKATFFLVNLWLEEYPDMAKEIALRGHEIGMHSATHPHFTRLCDEQIAEELSANERMITETTGYTPTIFRPPFGDYDNRVIAQINAAGYVPIQWSVDSLDWKDLSADEIYSRVTKDIHPGDIVLFHNNGLHTAEALPRILEYFQEQGLKAVPVSELIPEGEYKIDSNGILKAE